MPSGPRSLSELGWAGPVSVPEHSPIPRRSPAALDASASVLADRHPASATVDRSASALAERRPLRRRPSGRTGGPARAAGTGRGPYTFSRAPIVPGARDDRLIALADGGALAWGDDETTRRWTVDARAAGTMRWVLGPALPGPAFGAAGLLLADNSVLIVGGGDGRQVWHWFPGADRFERWPPLRTKRHGAALVADGEHGAWVIGGISETGEPSMRIEGVRPGGYVEAGMLTSPRPEPMAVVVDEMVVVLGLQAGVDAPELWDPSDDHHAVGRPAPEARTGASVIACCGKVLRAGGRAATSSPGAVLMPGTQLYDLQSDGVASVRLSLHSARPTEAASVGRAGRDHGRW